MDKKIPTLVRVIAVLYYIGAVLSVLGALAMLFFGANMGPLAMLGVVGAIFALIFGIISFFIGRGLYKGQNWARIVIIIFGILGLIIGLFSFMAGVGATVSISLIINLLITGYLLFNKEVKVAFSNNPVQPIANPMQPTA